WYLRQLFNQLVTHTPSPALFETLFTTVTIVAVAWLSAWLFRRLQDVTNMYYSAKVMQSLYDSTFGYIIGHSYNFFISRFAGSLTHRISKFVRSFEVMWDAIWLQFYPTALFVLGAIAVLT